MISAQKSWRVMVLTGLLLAPGCKRDDDGHPPAAKSTNSAPSPLPKPTDRVAALEEDFLVQPGQTTSDAAVPLPWQDVTPTRAAGAAIAAKRIWTGPAVLIGRQQLWLRDKAIAPVHCSSKAAASCTADGTRHSGSDASFSFESGQLIDGKLQALVDVAAELKDKQVPVVADRRVSWQAVEAVMAALRAVGAHPVLAAASHQGDLANVLGVGTALPEAPTLVAARRAAEPGESVAGSLPSDATALTISVSTSGVTVEVGRAAGEPVGQEIIGNIVESLIALAGRVRMAAPNMTGVIVRVEPNVPMEQVVQVIDGLRDDCGRNNHGQECTGRTQLFTNIMLQLSGALPEPVKEELDVPLHLDAAAPSGLHLSDTPDSGAKQPTSGLHLSP